MESTTRKDNRQELTDQLVAMLEAGVSPWQKPWRGAGRHHNPISGTVYSGGNALALRMHATQEGIDDPRWLTMNQVAQLNIKVMRDQGINIELRESEGGKGHWPFNADTGKALKFADWPVKVRAGSKSVAIEYWKDMAAEKANDGAAPAVDGPEAKKRLAVFTSRVFNASSIDGMPPMERAEKQFASNDLAEKASELSGVRVIHAEDDRACYAPLKDQIMMPPKETFKTPEGYYSTLLHEHAHATGHASRLNRPGIVEFDKFGSEQYAKEELRAELASVFIASEIGLTLDMSGHAAYLGAWTKTLKHDKNEIFRAASDATKAADMVLGPLRERGLLPEVKRIDLGEPVPVRAAPEKKAEKQKENKAKARAKADPSR